MRDILIVGAGKIGTVIADLLASSGDYAVTVADRDPAAVERVGAELARVQACVLDVGDADALAAELEGRWAVIDAGPFDIGMRIAAAAVAQRVHYLNLTEDVASTRRVRELAGGALSALIPQCGLAPGFISIVAHDLAARFDTQGVAQGVRGGGGIGHDVQSLQEDDEGLRACLAEQPLGLGPGDHVAGLERP